MHFSPERIGKSQLSERARRPAASRCRRPFSSSATRILVAAIGAAAVALTLPALASASYSYGWPIKPFGQAHPVRGQLNDPRMNGADFYSSSSHSFHFGLDIAAPDGKAVYAVAPGWVRYLSSSAIAVREPNDVTTFSYWHIRPVAKRGKKVKLHALLGYIERGYGHVHFAEKRDNNYVNPLRRGGLTPYVDTTRPTVSSVSYYDTAYHDLTSATLSGTVKFTVSAFDIPQMVSTWPWAVVTPSSLGWQVFDADGKTVLAGQWDLGTTLCPLDPLAVFAPGTLKNSFVKNVIVAGVYDYWLGDSWDTTRAQNGAYSLVVTAADIRGNQMAKTVDFTVANDPLAVAPAPPDSSPTAG